MTVKWPKMTIIWNWKAIAFILKQIGWPDSTRFSTWFLKQMSNFLNIFFQSNNLPKRIRLITFTSEMFQLQVNCLDMTLKVTRSCKRFVAIRTFRFFRFRVGMNKFNLETIRTNLAILQDEDLFSFVQAYSLHGNFGRLMGNGAP